MTSLSAVRLMTNMRSKSVKHTLSRALRFGFDEAFTISTILFAAAGLVLTQILTSFPIQAWNLILLASIIAGFLIEMWLVRSRSRNFVDLASPRPATNQSGFLASRWVAIALFLIFVPGFLSRFSSVTIQLPQHGYLHSAYVYQILNGFTPPENVTLPGYPGNFYWYYHALLNRSIFNRTREVACISQKPASTGRYDRAGIAV